MCFIIVDECGKYILISISTFCCLAFNVFPFSGWFKPKFAYAICTYDVHRNNKLKQYKFVLFLQRKSEQSYENDKMYSHNLKLRERLSVPICHDLKNVRVVVSN